MKTNEMQTEQMKRKIKEVAEKEFDTLDDDQKTEKAQKVASMYIKKKVRRLYDPTIELLRARLTLVLLNLAVARSVPVRALRVLGDRFG